MDVATSDNRLVPVEAILDTGTKPDWISKTFLAELGLKCRKLTPAEEKIFSDFNGNNFAPIGKANVMIYSNDWKGFSTRRLSFLVARNLGSNILLGSKTIKKEQLLVKPLPPKGEAVCPAVQTDPKKGKDYSKSFILEFC